MKIISKICRSSPCYTANKSITPKGLMLHSVGCSQPSALVFINQWNTPKPIRDVCPHAVIDANEGTIYQTLPWKRRGWHGGGTSNNTHIGVEMCEPACLEYKAGTASFTCSNLAEARKAAKLTYDAAVDLFAYLCAVYKLDPLADGVIISHAEGSKRGIASAHADPSTCGRDLDLATRWTAFAKLFMRQCTVRTMTAKSSFTKCRREHLQYRRTPTLGLTISAARVSLPVIL